MTESKIISVEFYVAWWYVILRSGDKKFWVTGVRSRSTGGTSYRGSETTKEQAIKWANEISEITGLEVRVDQDP